MIPDWLQVVMAIGSPAFAAGGAYMAVRVNLAWLRRDVDRAHQRIDAVNELIYSHFTFRGSKS